MPPTGQGWVTLLCPVSPWRLPFLLPLAQFRDSGFPGKGNVLTRHTQREASMSFGAAGMECRPGLPWSVRQPQLGAQAMAWGGQSHLAHLLCSPGLCRQSTPYWAPRALGPLPLPSPHTGAPASCRNQRSFLVCDYSLPAHPAEVAWICAACPPLQPQCSCLCDWAVDGL